MEVRSVNDHRYLRAYMAGITVPAMVVLIGVTVFALAKATLSISVPIERLMIFPMAVVPNAWGLWNILYLSMGLRGRVPIGIYGAALPFLLMPFGFLLVWQMQMFDFLWPWLAGVLPVAVLIYYLIWKLIVDRFNEILGIA
jgi:hypothetical protein